MNWKKEIEDEVRSLGEDIASLATTLTEAEMLQEFDGESYGFPKGKPFTAWTTNYVYFPAAYDGAEWVESVPRDPCMKKTSHVGG